MKIADKMFEKLGYTKVEGSDFDIAYEKTDHKFGFIHVIEFGHKASGNHLVHSYEKAVNTDGFTNSVGLTIPEIKAIKRKFKELKW
jgi:hypothetical protein